MMIWEGRDMSPNEQQLTEQALEIYEQLGERFKNYFLLDSNKSVDEIYKETEQKIKERGIIEWN